MAGTFKRMIATTHSQGTKLILDITLCVISVADEYHLMERLKPPLIATGEVSARGCPLPGSIPNSLRKLWLADWNPTAGHPRPVEKRSSAGNTRCSYGTATIIDEAATAACSSSSRRRPRE